MVKWKYCQLVHTIAQYENGTKGESVLLRSFTPEGTETDRIFEAQVEPRPEKREQRPNINSENISTDITGYLDVHAEWAERFFAPEGKNTYRNMMATLGSEGWEMIKSHSDVYKIAGEAEFSTLTSMFKRPIEG